MLTACTLAGLALLIGLGVWQLKRLAWKEGLIAEIETRAKGEPIALKDAIAVAREGRDPSYYRVRVDGRFDNAKELYLYSVADERVGWHVIAPLTATDGTVVIVDRGFVPDALRDPAKRAQGEIDGPVTVTGLARTPEIQGAFVPDNEVAANRWFWRDLADMTKAVYPDGAPGSPHSSSRPRNPTCRAAGPKAARPISSSPTTICSTPSPGSCSPAPLSSSTWSMSGAPIAANAAEGALAEAKSSFKPKRFRFRVSPEAPIFRAQGSEVRFVSTRGEAPALSFEGALLAAMARDAGLLMPEVWPRLTPDEIAALAGLDYADVAYRIMRPFLEGDACLPDLETVLEEAYGSFHHPAVAPLRQIGPNEFLLELFHGPTLAFKDVAMQVVARLMNRALMRKGAHATVIGATSGDTGAAAIEAFRGLEAIDIFILHPKGRVSDVQRRQMTTATEPTCTISRWKGRSTIARRS